MAWWVACWALSGGLGWFALGKRVNLSSFSALFSPLCSHPEHQPSQGFPKVLCLLGQNDLGKSRGRAWGNPIFCNKPCAGHAELGEMNFPATKPVQGMHVLTHLQAGRVNPSGDPRALGSSRSRSKAMECTGNRKMKGVCEKCPEQV